MRSVRNCSPPLFFERFMRICKLLIDTKIRV